MSSHTIKIKVCCWVWSTGEGEHWVAVFKNHCQFYFFYSFVKSPQFYNRTYLLDQPLTSSIRNRYCLWWVLPLLLAQKM